MEEEKVTQRRVPQYEVIQREAGGMSGWKGDSPIVHLDITKLQGLGWAPKTSIAIGIRKTVRYLLEHPEVFESRLNVDKKA